MHFLLQYKNPWSKVAYFVQFYFFFLPFVAICPEPTINIDRLQSFSITALVQKIALSATGPHCGNIILSNFGHDLQKILLSAIKNTP